MDGVVNKSQRQPVCRGAWSGRIGRKSVTAGGQTRMKQIVFKFENHGKQYLNVLPFIFQALFNGKYSVVGYTRLTQKRCVIRLKGVFTGRGINGLITTINI